MNEKLHFIQHKHAKQLKKYSALNMFSCQQPLNPASHWVTLLSLPWTQTLLFTLTQSHRHKYSLQHHMQIDLLLKKGKDWILFTWRLTERCGSSWLVSVKMTDSAWMPETGCPTLNVSLYFKKTKHQNICTVTLCWKPTDSHSARCILLLTWPRWAQREIFTSSLDFQPSLTACHVFPAKRWNMRLADISKICHKSLHVRHTFCVCQSLVNSSLVPALNSLTYVLCIICSASFTSADDHDLHSDWCCGRVSIHASGLWRKEQTTDIWYHLFWKVTVQAFCACVYMCVYASMCLERACSFLWTYPNRSVPLDRQYVLILCVCVTITQWPLLQRNLNSFSTCCLNEFHLPLKGHADPFNANSLLADVSGNRFSPCAYIFWLLWLVLIVVTESHMICVRPHDSFVKGHCRFLARWIKCNKAQRIISEDSNRALTWWPSVSTVHLYAISLVPKTHPAELKDNTVMQKS